MAKLYGDEQVLGKIDGSYMENKGRYKHGGDAGKWTITNARLHFRFMGLTRYEVSIFYEDIVGIKKSRNIGYYTIFVQQGSKSAEVADVHYFGVAPWKSKEAFAYLIDQVGEDRIIPSGKFERLPSYLYFGFGIGLLIIGVIGIIVCAALGLN